MTEEELEFNLTAQTIVGAGEWEDWIDSVQPLANQIFESAQHYSTAPITMDTAVLVAAQIHYAQEAA